MTFLRVKLGLYLTLLFLLSASSGVSAANSKNEEAKKLIASLSPLPAENNIHGIAFTFSYRLLLLYQAIHSPWLNPDSPEYLYSGDRTLAPAPLTELKSHVLLYESIRTDYLKLLSEGKIDRYGEPDLGGNGDLRLPPFMRLRLKASNAVYVDSYFANGYYSKLLTIFHKSLWDDRFLTTGFFSVHVNSKHRPLESMVSLSRASGSALKVIERLQRTFGERKENNANRFLRLIEEAVNADEATDPVDLFRTLDKLEADSKQYASRLTFVGEKLYRAVQYANDIVRNQKVSDSKALETAAAALGKGLHSALDAVAVYRRARTVGASLPKYKFEGTRLSDPFFDLNEVFGIDGHHSGYTLYPEQRGPNDQNAYSMYVDALVVQYILAAGSMMAKISEIPEGRGGFSNLLSQELKYRRAQINAYLGLKPAGPSNETQTQALMTLDNKPQTLAAATVQRRDFVDPTLENTRKAIEDRIWKIFFDSADIHFESYGDPSDGCARLLTSVVMERQKN